MKGPETPRDLHEPFNKESVLPISKAQRPPEASRKRICSTYMKGPETSMSLLTRNLFYLYEGLRDPSEASQRRICSTYMRGPKNLHEPLNKQFVLPI